MHSNIKVDAHAQTVLKAPCLFLRMSLEAAPEHMSGISPMLENTTGYVNQRKGLKLVLIDNHLHVQTHKQELLYKTSALTIV